ncbi:MAG TPA: hypothetical protein VK752_01750 [Bryobacteraceae bacterium]|jgi:hypothetical protein|nr:hypothetical protein [Bryobacteraceae bacterium]
MNTRDQLNHYLRGLETRLRWLTVSKGIAIALGVALGATLAMVWFTNALAFSNTSITIARVVLFLALAAALGFALILPLLRLNQHKTVKSAETTFPEFNQRLLTYIERGEARDPMLDLLANDAFSVANKTEPERVAPRRNIFAFATAGGAAGAALLWMILAGPGFLGYGSSLLWAGLPKGMNGVNFYDIIVDPGNKLVRRKADQMVTATLTGFQAPQVRLFARYRSTSKWEEAAMIPRASGSAYEFLFASLPEPVEYYVEAAGVKSKTYKLDVADLPGIKNIKVTYHYPSWLGLKDAVEDPGGDLRAVAGTVAELTIETDRPLKAGEIMMDDGSKIALESKEGNFVSAKIPVEKDGMYHFAATERGESVRLSEDYFIEARQDQPPTVKIVTPHGDAKVSPIEEVTVTVEAADDFALESMELHYSVNGAPEKTVNLLTNKGVKEASGKTLITLEDYKLEAGDVVSVYATARDARNTARTDIAFIETQPFEKNYTQSQQQGGMPGMPSDGADQTEISRRQKEIIAATWNEIRGGAKNKVNSAENAKFLAGIQTKLKEQAKSLADRARSRELAGANQEFQAFVKDLDEAVKQMDPASNKLGAQAWKDALEPEEKALQHLLRAEATFRDIQVAFGGGGRGGGGGQNAGRDLANLFDLELDTEKNQYETGQQQSASQAKEKAVDEALQKLEELAQRQKQLADQQAKSKQQTFEQRWQQEMLRRDAEELKKQMEQLSRDGSQQSASSQQSQQQGQPNSGGQGQPSQGGQQSQNQPQQSGQANSQQSGQSGKQQPNQPQSPQDARSQQQQMQRSLGQRNGTNDQRLQQALERVTQAEEAMRAAQKASQQSGAQGQQQGGSPQKGASPQQGGQMQGDGQKSGQQQQNQAGQAEANARRAAESLQEAKSLLNGMRRQESSSQLGDLEQRAEKLAGEQRDLENRMRKEYGAQAMGERSTSSPQQARQTAEQMASEKEKMVSELDRLETDMKKSARDLAQTQPDASARVRDGLSEIQQNEAKARMTASASWLRRGQGPLMVPREAPITQALDKMTDDLKQAQSALRNGGQTQGNNDLERSLARVERTRSQLERMAGNGQKDPNGQQQGGGQQDGQQQGGRQAGGQQAGSQQGGGQQSGGNQQGGGQQAGGRQPGQQTGGGYGSPGYGQRGGNRQYGAGFGRFGPEGMYDAPLDRPVDPNEAVRLAARDLNEMRQLFKDNPDVQKQIGEVEHDLQKLTVGDIATAELQQRLNREVLPNLQALEVKLRREVEEQGGGQVKSGATDKVPPGFSDAVAEYFRKLSKGNQ